MEVLLRKQSTAHKTHSEVTAAWNWTIITTKVFSFVCGIHSQKGNYSDEEGKFKRGG